MGRAGTVEELAWAVLKEAGRACEARAAALLIDEEDAGAWIYLLQVRDGRGTRPSDVVRLPHRRGGDGALGHALQAGEAVSLSARTPGTARGGAPTLEGEVSGRLADKFGHPIESVIAVPLEGEDAATVGAMALYNSKKGAFTQDDRSLLRLVSANASTAVRLFRSRVERERSERLTAIGRLLSGVMHDVRTPLTVISGYVQLMAGADDAETRGEYARLVLKQFDVITAMQREVLEFARGERNILLRKVFLAKFFGDIEQQLAQQVAGTGVRLVVDIADRGTARFDEAKMTRVVHNLARNAIEAMADAGGTLTIRCAREQGELVMSFADTGKGIPKEIEGRLFQSFVTAGKAQGTGLGLAIVKKIVDEHAGTISVESSERGATFTVRLPADPQPERSPKRTRAVT
jgi:signal transduction histidine kinase